MLLTLVELGYVAQDADHFSLTPRLLELGFVYLNSVPFYRTAQDTLEALSEEINELCSLSVLDGNETVYLVHVQGRDFLRRGMGVGTRLPAYATSMGRVLLAGRPPAESEGILKASALERLTPTTTADLAELTRLIDRARRDGYSLVVEELVAGVIGMSVPVKDSRGNVVAAAGISFNPSRFKKRDALDTCLPLLRKAAGQHLARHDRAGVAGGACHGGGVRGAVVAIEEVVDVAHRPALRLAIHLDAHHGEILFARAQLPLVEEQPRRDGQRRHGLAVDLDRR